MRLRCYTSLLLALVSGVAAAQPFSGATFVPCRLEKQDHYSCNAALLRAALRRAQTLGVATARIDVYAHNQLEQLAASLGKRVVEPAQQPDLLLSIAPVERSGRIEYGPGGVALGTLRVTDARGTLLWVQTYDGANDQPWQAVVMHLLQGFREDALQH